MSTIVMHNPNVVMSLNKGDRIEKNHMPTTYLGRKCILPKGAFTLGVRYSSVESPNIMLVIYDLNLLILKILC
jgi:hypothetical protein